MRIQDVSVNAWWAAEPEHRGQAMLGVVTQLRNRQRPRVDLAERQLAHYIGCQTSELTPEILMGIYPESSPSNLVRRIVDTYVANVIAKQRPKAQITTAGADYRTRLTARQQSKFLLANMYQPQGSYADGWELEEQVGRDSAIWGTGVTKVYANLEEGKIAHERRYLFDLLFDENDAEHGSPQNLFDIYPYDKYVLSSIYPEHEKAIMAGDTYRSFTFAAGVQRSDRVMVIDGYRLPIGKKPGRHVRVVGNMSGVCGTLVDEEWNSPRFPFALHRYKRNAIGAFMGSSLVDEIASAQQLYDEVFEDCRLNVRAHAGGLIVAPEGSIINEDVLTSTERAKVVYFKAEPGMAPPEVKMPAPFNPAVFQWLQMLKSTPNEQAGISELTSQGRKEPGIESGVAIRTVSDIQNTLFLPQSRNYERHIVNVGRLDIDAANAIVDNKGKISLSLPDEGFLDEIDWKAIRFPGDSYKVNIQAVSSLEDTVAARKQRVIEMVGSGSLSAQTADRILDSGALDIEQANPRQRSQMQYLDKVIAKYQAFDAGKDDESGIRVYPDPLLDMDMAIIQLTDAYVEMLGDEFPEENLALVRDLIGQFDQEIAKRAPKPQQMMAGAVGGGAVPGAVQGAGPMPPPMPPPGAPMPAPAMN